MKELKKELLESFWNIYETDGAIQALSWLESLKYFEDYCQDDIANITNKIANL